MEQIIKFGISNYLQLCVEAGFSQIQSQLWLQTTLYHCYIKSFTANVLKCTAHLKTKVKYVSVTICSLAMSLFSHDFIETEID